MIWFEKFIPDYDSCVALFTMGFVQQNSTFVWTDLGIADAQGKQMVRIERTVEYQATGKKMFGVFAAFTAEEFQTILPVNFVPLKTPDGWSIIDLHDIGFKQPEGEPAKKAQHIGIVLKNVPGSKAKTAAQAYANAAIYLIQAKLLRLK